MASVGVRGGGKERRALRRTRRRVKRRKKTSRDPNLGREKGRGGERCRESGESAFRCLGSRQMARKIRVAEVLFAPTACRVRRREDAFSSARSDFYRRISRFLEENARRVDRRRALLSFAGRRDLRRDSGTGALRRYFRRRRRVENVFRRLARVSTLGTGEGGARIISGRSRAFAVDRTRRALSRLVVGGSVLRRNCQNVASDFSASDVRLLSLAVERFLGRGARLRRRGRRGKVCAICVDVGDRPDESCVDRTFVGGSFDGSSVGASSASRRTAVWRGVFVGRRGRRRRAGT